MFEPTDEQIEALAKALANQGPDSEWMGGYDVPDQFVASFRDSFMQDADELIASLAFQAIIRAARANALREAANVAEAYSNWKADTAFHVASILRERAHRIESADV